MMSCPISCRELLEHTPKKLHLHPEEYFWPLCEHRGNSSADCDRNGSDISFPGTPPVPFPLSEMAVIVNAWGWGDNDFLFLHAEALLFKMDPLITSSVCWPSLYGQVFKDCFFPQGQSLRSCINCQNTKTLLSNMECIMFSHAETHGRSHNSHTKLQERETVAVFT